MAILMSIQILLFSFYSYALCYPGEKTKIIPTVNPNFGVTATAVVSSNKRFRPTHATSVENTKNLKFRNLKKYQLTPSSKFYFSDLKKYHPTASSRLFRQKNKKSSSRIKARNRKRRNLPISNPHPLASLLPVLHKKVQLESTKNIASIESEMKTKENESPPTINGQTFIKNNQMEKLNENIIKRLESNEMFDGDNSISLEFDNMNNNMELTNEMRTTLNLGQDATIENKDIQGDKYFKLKFPSIRKYSDSIYRLYSNGTLSGVTRLPGDEIKSKALEGKDFSDFSDFFESPSQKKNLETSVVQATNNTNLLKNVSVVSQTNSTISGSVNKIKTTNKNSDGKTVELGYSTDPPNGFKEDGQKINGTEIEEEDDDDPTPTDSTNLEIATDSTSEPLTEETSEENAKTTDSFEKDDDLEKEDAFSDDDENDDTTPTDEPITTPVTSSAALRKRRDDLAYKKKKR